MKNKILGCLLFATLALGLVCAFQWRQLAATRQRLAKSEQTLQAELQNREEQDNQLKELQRQRDQLDRDVADLNRLATNLRSRESQSGSNLAQLARQIQGKADTGTKDADGEKGGLFGGKGMANALSKMMKDPAMKEMMRSQQKAVMSMMYGPLLKDLNLAPEQKEKFMALLLDQQLKAIDHAGALLPDGAADKTDAVKQVQDNQKELDENLKTLLGDEKFAQYQDYKQTMTERMQLDQFKQQLEGGKTPLQDEQVKSLLQVMREEKEKVPPIFPEHGAGMSPDFTKLLTDETMDRQFEWQADLNRRVLERAGPILAPEQLKELTDFQAQQLNMQKMSMKMASEMFGNGQTPANVNVLVAPVK